MERVIIKVINLKEILQKHDALGKIDVMPVIVAAGRKVQKTAKNLAPVDTGALRNSIKVTKYPKQQSVTVGTNLEYAPHQEFGTVRLPANPYLGPAININRAGINNMINRFMRAKLKNPKAAFEFPESKESAGKDFIYVKTSGGRITKEKNTNRTKKGDLKRIRRNVLRNKPGYLG
jgi:HK97 gp10 family phage protein